MSENRKAEPPRRRGRKVGYRQPPAEHQFRKGEPSRNPRGRPPKKPPRVIPPGPDPHLHLIVLEEGNRLVTLTENGRDEQVPMIVAIVRKLQAKAASGDVRALLKYVELYQEGERQRLKDAMSLVESALEHKRKWAEVFERHDQAGLNRPEVVPHPDDIQIDLQSGQVRVNGPRDKAEKIEWDNAQEARAEAEAELYELRAELEDHPERRDEIEREIESLSESIALIDATFPAPHVRRAPGFELEEWRGRNRR